MERASAGFALLFVDVVSDRLQVSRHNGMGAWWNKRFIEKDA